jgi:serine/threonine protein kinase
VRDSRDIKTSPPTDRGNPGSKSKPDPANWQDDNDLKVVLDRIGTVYKILENLGQGGYSKIYKIYHRVFEEARVLKIMDSQFLLQRLEKKNFQERKRLYDEIVQRFLREAKIYYQIDHPNIVKIHEIDVVINENNFSVPFFIMPYIRGVSLDVLIKQKIRLDMDTAIKISRDILSSLQEIHSVKIIHRDIKPGNIIIDKLTDRAILIDFGLAKILEEANQEPERSMIGQISEKDKIIQSRLTASDQSMGTPSYMSPEQYSGMKYLGPETDIYSFGVVMFEMLSGQVPLMHENLQQPVPDIGEFNPSVPKGVRDIISKAMAKKPGDRYKTVRELLNELDKIIKETEPIKYPVIHRLQEIPIKPAQDEKEVATKVKGYPRKSISPAVISIISAVLIIIIVIGLWLIFKPAGPGKHYRELIDSANRCIEKSDYKGAESHLKQALKIKETPEYRWLLETVENKQREKENIAKMKEDFNKLQAALKGSASLDRKKEQCRAFLEKHKEIPSNAETDGMISEIQQSLADLEAAMQKAKQEKETPEVNQQAGQNETKKLENERNGTPVYDYIKDSMDIKKYLEFKDRYPKSIHLPDLKNRLKAADQVLPPEDYWEKPIKKKQTGYYEYQFGPEQNGHLMIYIPGKNYWIDKYEVSNLQFRNFLKALSRKSSTPIGDDGNPAVVEYEEAENYCRKYGFRLPTETEWEYAANAGKNIDYPWGNESPDENSIYRANFNSFDGNVEKDEYNLFAPVKSFENFSSPFGIVSMAGNVEEWVQGKIFKGGGIFSKAGDLEIKKSTAGKSGTKKGFRCLKNE